MPINKTKLANLKKNMRQTFNDISEKKAKQFVNQVLLIGRSESAMYAPVEYSNLINSVTMNIDISGSSTTGTLAYNASYAAFLEFNKNWNPRPVNMKAGPATNMNATPHYLQKGFESPESQRAIDKAREIFKI